MSLYSPCRAAPADSDEPPPTSRVWGEMMFCDGTPFSSRTGHAALRCVRPRLQPSDEGSESMDDISISDFSTATEEVIYIFGGTDCRSRVSGEHGRAIERCALVRCVRAPYVYVL